MPPDVTAPVPRRARVRAATEVEIRQVARRLLVRDGLREVTLRAIATEMGLTAPALYRYYPSHDDVLAAVTVDCFAELVTALRDAQAAEAPEDAGAVMLATCRAFRDWALAHPAEFGLVFANPMPSPLHHPTGPVHEAGIELATVFAGAFVPMWQQVQFDVPAADALDPALRADLAAYRPLLGGLPEGAMFVFVATWARLVGVVSAEVFGQLTWATTHTGPFFEDLLAELAVRMGLPQEALGA